MEQQLTTSQLLLFTERYNKYKKSLGIAILLCCFTGFIGGHKFYMRKTGSGICYLIFCWTLIPTLLSALDLVVLPYQINRYNNLLAVEILSDINPNAEAAGTLDIFKNKHSKPLLFLAKTISFIIIIMATSAIYKTFLADDNSWELSAQGPQRLIDQIDYIHRSQQKEPAHYAINYDGLALTMPLEKAKLIGYDQCNSNKIYTVCSNNKNTYPDFYHYQVKYAIAQFDSNDQLIIIHIYPNSLPNYNQLAREIPLSAHGTRHSVEYMEVSGSHEEIFINTIESSIDLYDNEIIQNYAKKISQQKILQ
ncbi:TM2 domain-containing protein [Aquella oligotrophica]|uniref:TM2 domain-containing protein n=1 Tax=Aquella oligotrophica TaxID=2067065 RepID=A0A2I7N3Z2_9NEIS|nr:TM2 domain-containing protein [Aquella oligotrophica]AUR51187.1 hypothetical protein CUN60_02335 [Aquella oligotrophica]